MEEGGQLARLGGLPVQTHGIGVTFPRRRPVQVENLLVVDDHPLMCDALALTLKMAFALRKVRTARSLETAVEAIRSDGAPDAVVLDFNLPDASGTEGIVTIMRLLPDIPVTMISADIDADRIGASLDAGAQGFVSKSLSRELLIDAFRRMWAGEVVVPEKYDPKDRDAPDGHEELMQRFATLTPQQMRIMRLIWLGKANKEISYELGIAEATVKTHITAIMAKINARRRTQAVLLANTVRLFEPS